MQMLDQLGYIIKEQRRDAGRFGAVDYFICEQPVVKSPDTQKWDTVAQDVAGSDSEPFVEKSDTANLDTEESDTFSQDTILNPNSINSQKNSIHLCRLTQWRPARPHLADPENQRRSKRPSISPKK